MSCFVCNDVTIAAVAFWACGPKATRYSRLNAGMILAAENLRAFNARYPRHHSDGPAEHTPTVHDLKRVEDLDPREALGAIRCYRYQIAETSDWEHTPAGLISAAALTKAEIVAGTDNPGDFWDLN